MRFLLQHFYSVAIRPDDSLVLGTSRGWKGMPSEVYQSIINSVDDSQGHDIISANALEAIGSIFPKSGWGGPAKGGFEYAWAGIIGMVSLASVHADDRLRMRCLSSGMFRRKKVNTLRRDITGMVSFSTHHTR